MGLIEINWGLIGNQLKIDREIKKAPKGLISVLETGIKQNDTDSRNFSQHNHSIHSKSVPSF
jgi:hypothetical protein